MSDYPEKYQKIRKQLIGFAALLLIMAFIAPWIITDKSNRQTESNASLHLIALNDNNKKSDNKPISNLDNEDAINMPRLPDGTADIDAKTEPAQTSLTTKNETKAAQVKTEVSTLAQTGAKTDVKTPNKQEKPVPDARLKSAPAPKAAPQPTKLKPENKNYIIQLVALKNKQKIDELTALLLLHNYEVQVTPKNPELNQVIKLQLGPYVKREQAEQVIIDLKNLTKLEGKILAN